MQAYPTRLVLIGSARDCFFPPVHGNATTICCLCASGCYEVRQILPVCSISTEAWFVKSRFETTKPILWSTSFTSQASRGLTMDISTCEIEFTPGCLTRTG